MSEPSCVHPPAGLLGWLSGGDRGISSEKMVSHLVGLPSRDRGWFGSYPHDPADFARCVKLLEAVPSLRARLGKMATVCAEWAALVGAWDKLLAMLEAECPEWRAGQGSAGKTYDAMRALIDGCRASV